MKTILVTGPIGSGKSEVCRYLRSEGYAVYDSDSRTKALYESIPGLKSRIEEELGVPFSGIGIIFSDADKRARLEGIVYPIVLEDMEKWRRSVIEDGGYSRDRIFIESAVALDKPMFDGLFDEVWLVDAPFEQRVARNPKARERDSIQHFDPDRVTRVIINDTTLDNLYRQI